MGLKINLWSILSCVFMAYIANSVYHLYKIYFPSRCNTNEKIQNSGSRHKCLDAALDPQQEKVLLTIYLSTTGRSSTIDFQNAVLRKDKLDLNSDFEEHIEINIPKRTSNNGTLWLHAFLSPISKRSLMDDPRNDDWYVERKSMITNYMVPKPETINLMKKEDKNEQGDLKTAEKPTSHLRSIVTLVGVGETFSFFWNNVPGEIVSLLQLNDKQKYLPIFTVEELHYRMRDLEKIGTSSNKMNITIRYQSTSIGKLRLLYTAKQSTESLRSLGFTDKDIDEVKGIFTDTNFYFLALTFFVAAVHLLLDFLAFKNDISFWRNRKTMVGISTKTLIWRFFSQAIVFFYLLDENTSLLILIPTGLGVLIELWKLSKAFKVTIDFRGKFGSPRLRFGLVSKQEQETADFDAQGMHYLVYILTPLCISGAVYSLLYVPHKSWYSWFVQSLANAVYAFGFLFMLPQLFINYKLKSVAHLPWRAFMYKAFNTFIDDMFAFIISMPTAHRVACFRDDVVFVVYLYQRYLYPVDKSRVNEFGECFDKEENKKTK